MRGTDPVRLPVPPVVWWMYGALLALVATLWVATLVGCSSCCEKPRACRWIPPPPGPAAKSCGAGKCSGAWECNGPIVPEASR